MGAGRVVGWAALIVVLPLLFLIHHLGLHLAVGVNHPEEVLDLQDREWEWEQSNSCTPNHIYIGNISFTLQCKLDHQLLLDP